MPHSEVAEDDGVLKIMVEEVRRRVTMRKALGVRGAAGDAKSQGEVVV